MNQVVRYATRLLAALPSGWTLANVTFTRLENSGTLPVGPTSAV